MKKTIMTFLGFVFFGLGILGIILPILPTTPFLILATIFFAKGSKRFNDWFKNTKIYNRSIQPLIENRSMSVSSKIKSLVLITILFSIPLILIESKTIKIIVFIVLLIHYIVFIFRVKTMPYEEYKKMSKERLAYERED